MPAPEAQDQQVVELLLTVLGRIGNAGDWLTAPDKVDEGSWQDPLLDLHLQLFLDHQRTGNRDADADLDRHAWQFEANVWIVAQRKKDDATRGRKLLRQAAADVMRAVQAAEGEFEVLTGDMGVRIGDYQVRNELVEAGFACASLGVTVYRSQEHDSP